MTINLIIDALEELAPPSLQESYDNCGLLVGNSSMECKGIITSLDVTEAVIFEAIEKGCNLIVAHHPIIFKGLKKLNGKNYVERTIILAIKNNIAIYAIHTNLDNILQGVNHTIADKLGLHKREILLPKPSTLVKLFTFVPIDHAAKVRDALFAAGAGNIGNYSECSYTSQGEGTFKAGIGSDPYLGNIGELHTEPEVKLEVILPVWLKSKVQKALRESHPYEEIAHEFILLENVMQETGSGLLGHFSSPVPELEFMRMLKDLFKVPVIRHSPFVCKDISTVALCGGAGSFLVPNAIALNADAFVTGDMKYHE
ncbi:MAG: Nif3-like dinuclear metal center hexameric protein, partial [Chitinophagaceae bacterium]